jgi:hypothetical protein
MALTRGSVGFFACCDQRFLGPKLEQRQQTKTQELDDDAKRERRDRRGECTGAMSVASNARRVEPCLTVWPNGSLCNLNSCIGDARPTSIRSTRISSG